MNFRNAPPLGVWPERELLTGFDGVRVLRLLAKHMSQAAEALTLATATCSTDCAASPQPISRAALLPVRGPASPRAPSHGLACRPVHATVTQPSMAAACHGRTLAVLTILWRAAMGALHIIKQDLGRQHLGP